MKNILFLILGFVLLTTIAQAQLKWITAGDSIHTKDNSEKGTYTIISIQDTTGGSTDTLVCEVLDEGIGWISWGVSNMTGKTWGTLMIPGNGSLASFLVNAPTPNNIRVRRTNVTNLSSKTKVNFMTINSYF